MENNVPLLMHGKIRVYCHRSCTIAKVIARKFCKDDLDVLPVQF